ncbi:MAG TPA: ACP S-malonyltransferase [Microbacterium sp.]|uniref:ACP S-malonyltransferase n=1 Tax=Microbacterium sp. TaxID=51671 RepID=UPI002B67C852|nr:ACP S-malonyltransferase [Microbacterium sp.]HWI30530.1 ACP S-malonyltransferase [Microbacterium sp.]
MIVVVCPGQGSQTPGFLSPWLERDGVRARLEQLSDAAEVDLVAHGTVSDADIIRDTSVAQPLIVAASLVAWEALGDATAGVGGVAGHSVGEIAALVASGVLDAGSGMRLVGIRGRAMAESASRASTGMSAVVGGDEAEVLAKVAEHGLSPANYNGGGQLVVAGPLEALAALASDGPRGARVIPLQVAGAFHTDYMAPARDALQAAVDDLAAAGRVSDPRLRLWTNRDGTTVDDGARAVELLVGQVASPVRWDLCMASFAEQGVTGIVELAPAGALTGLAKRALRGVPSVAIRTPDDLAAAASLLSGDAS